MPRALRTYLYQLVHPTTGVTMEFDPWGNSSESSFDRPMSTYVVPGMNSPMDAIGDAANAMSSRQLSFTFVRPYAVVNGVKETFSEAQADFKRMVAHGKRMTAVRKTTTGTLQFGRVKLTSLPDKPSADDDIAAVFTATFDLTPPWWNDLHATSAHVYDLGGLVYDVGNIIYDDDAFHLNATSLTVQVDSVAATLPDYGAQFVFYAPFGGDSGIRLTNQSVFPNMSFTIPIKLTGTQMLVIDAATEAVRLNAIPRPDLLIIPRGQFDVMILEAGLKNNLLVESLGANQLSGGKLSIESLNKYA